MSGQMAPYRIARSLLNYAAQVYAIEPLPLRQRQALALWHEFLDLPNPCFELVLEFSSTVLELLL